MKWSFAIGKIAGTELHLHLSLPLLIIVSFAGLSVWGVQPATVGQTLFWGISHTLILLSCILFHELGHTLIARRYGVTVERIILWALGGLTVMADPPDRPLARLWIAAAGSLVNILLALGVGLSAIIGLILAGLTVGALFQSSDDVLYVGQIFGLVTSFVGFNIALAIINLCPVYPFDGGHILHAFLDLRLDRRRANISMFLIRRSASAYLKAMP